MKKHITIVFALLIIVALFSCQSDDSENGSPENSNNLPTVHVNWPKWSNYNFQHPCLLHTEADFDYVRTKAVVEQKQPWLMGYEKLQNSGKAKKTYVARPQEVVSRPGTGDYNVITYDGAAAYQLALMWKMTGDDEYADASLRIMNAWAKTNTLITDREAILVAGFTGVQYANALEILRGYSGWQNNDFEVVKKWLIDVFYPVCDKFLKTHNGADASHAWMSWDLPAMVTMLSIGVVCDDANMVNQAVDYFYNGAGAGNIRKSVIARHKDPDGNVEIFAQSQEMGRDQGHATLNVPLHAYFCQMAYNALGIDLFAYDDNAVLDLCEYTAKYNVEPRQFPVMPFTPYYYPRYDEWHEEVSSTGQGKPRPGWELIYNHYKLKGANPYYSREFARRLRPEGGGVANSPNGDDNLGFGTLMYTREPIEAGEDQLAIPL